MLRNWTRYGDPSGRITEKILDNAVITLQAQALARIAHTRFRSGSCGDFECGDGVQEADFRAHPALSGLVGVEEWAPGVFLASTMRVWEQGPPLAEASSLSCVNKSSFELQPAGIAQRFAQARRKVSW